MPDWTVLFGASKAESTLLVLFIPSGDRTGQAINQEEWVDKALDVLGTYCGGATAFPRGRGVWRDDQQGGKLIYDNPVVVQCYTNEAILEQHAARIGEFLVQMGKGTNQGAVGYVIDRDYLEIQFALEESAHGQERSEDR